MLWSSVLVQSNEHNIVIFSVLVDFVFVSEVRYYLRIDKSLLGQIRRISELGSGSSNGFTIEAEGSHEIVFTVCVEQ